jgi:hypothetical protein
VTNPNVENAIRDGWAGIDGIGHGEQRPSNWFDRADLAVAMACLDPDAVLV